MRLQKIPELSLLLFLTRFIDGENVTKKGLKKLAALQKEMLGRYLEQGPEKDPKTLFNLVQK